MTQATARPTVSFRSSERYRGKRRSGVGRQRQNAAGIGERTSAAAVRHIAAARDSDFRRTYGEPTPRQRLTLRSPAGGFSFLGSDAYAHADRFRGVALMDFGGNLG